MSKVGRPPSTPESILARRTPQDPPPGLDPSLGPCLMWTKCVDKNGYGRVTIERKTLRVHRVAWELVHGPIPEDKAVQHLCNTPACSNVSHLVLGDCKANHDYMKACGRAPIGDRNGRHTKPDKRAVLDEDAVRTIRASTLSDTELARNLRVNRSTVRKVRDGTNWQHVDIPANELEPKIKYTSRGHARGDANGAFTHPESRPKGESHGRARLTEIQVREIRASTLSNVELGRQYGVTDTAISFIRSRRTWRSLKD